MQALDSIIQKIEDFYSESDQPAAVVDSGLLILWINKCAQKLFPALHAGDGIRSMLSPEDIKTARQSLQAGRSVYIHPRHLPLSTTGLFFTPLCHTDSSYAALVYFSPVQAPSGAEAYAANSVQAVSTFSSQIRSPLSLIFTSLSTLYRNEEIPHTDRVQQPLQNINQNSYRILRQCINLTEFTRFSNGAAEFLPHIVDLCAYLSEQCKAVRNLTLGNGIPFEFQLPTSPIFCNCDTEMLDCALFNILSNSCKFTREGNHILLTLEKLAGRARLTISDHGSGIPSAVLPQIFEPFFSYSKESGEAGGGLGLVVAKQCVAAHGGTVMVSSVEDHGTTVVITLPVLDSVPQELPLASPTSMQIMTDRFSSLNVLFSDVCKSPWP